jgi:F-box and WD-40 domain protein MET30
MTLVLAQSMAQSYVCDTLPAPRLATDHPLISLQVPDDPVDITSASSSMPDSKLSNPRKLCVRHQRMADEGTNLKLQQVCIQI